MSSSLLFRWWGCGSGEVPCLESGTPWAIEKDTSTGFCPSDLELPSTASWHLSIITHTKKCVTKRSHKSGRGSKGMHMGDSLSKERAQTIEELKEHHHIAHGVSNGFKEELQAWAWFKSFNQFFVSQTNGYLKSCWRIPSSYCLATSCLGLICKIVCYLI